MRLRSLDNPRSLLTLDSGEQCLPEQRQRPEALDPAEARFDVEKRGARGRY
jgi:hypothetical protein